MEIGDYDAAITCMKNCLDIRSKLTHFTKDVGVARAHTGLATAYNKKGMLLLSLISVLFFLE